MTRVVIAGESDVDESAVGFLVRAILERHVEIVKTRVSRSPGVDSVLLLLDKFLRDATYRQDSVDGIVVIVDSDESWVDATSEPPGLSPRKRSRLLQIQERIAATLAAIKVPDGREPLQFAVGLAVPCIEAWWLIGTKHQVTEGQWRQGQESDSVLFKKRDLKKRLYGTDRPSLTQTIDGATDGSRRAAENLDALRQHFPLGFGTLFDQLKNWR